LIALWLSLLLRSSLLEDENHLFRVLFIVRLLKNMAGLRCWWHENLKKEKKKKRKKEEGRGYFIIHHHS
jgi:hypothetical protein